MRLLSKFLCIVVPAGLLAVAVVLFLIRRSVHAVIVEGLERSSIAFTRAAAAEADRGAASGREADLLSLLQELERREGALYAEALDLHGKVLAHTTVTQRGLLKTDPFTRAALSAKRPIAEKFGTGQETVLLVAAPVWAKTAASETEEFMMSGESGPERKRLGTIVSAVAMAADLNNEAIIIRDIFMIVLVIGVIAFGLVTLLVRGILVRIRGLMAGIARVGKGSYDVHVTTSSRDELGELARSFNRMSGELARTTVSKEYVEGVLENIYDLLLVTDTTGRIRTANRAAEDAFGAAGLIGRPFDELFETPLQAGVVRDAEVVLRTKDDGRMLALFSSTALRDREGRLQGYIGVAKDITARKRDEKALLSAMLAAEASSRELEAFSYSVAHDLRAPLRAVDGFSKLLLDKYSDDLDEQAREYLRRVRGGSKKMDDLINDLLELSRITRGDLKLGTVNLSALAGDIAAEFKRAEPGRRVELVIAPGLAARGDPGLLRVALTNLIGNSWKYTSKHASVRIEFGAVQRDGRSVYFVRDDGAGFDMAYANKLFQPFTRLHTPADFAGTGIGLATVARVVARHEGKIWGEGEVERGAAFYFTLWEKNS